MNGANYNPIFENLVDVTEPEPRQLIAYGFYKQAKREWAAQLGQAPTPDELQAYTKTWTESLLAGLLQRADTVLAGYSEEAIDAAAPQIREDALRGTARSAIGYSILGCFFYSLILIVVAVLLRIAGIDVIGVIESVGRPSQSEVTSPSRPIILPNAQSH